MSGRPGVVYYALIDTRTGSDVHVSMNETVCKQVAWRKERRAFVGRDKMEVLHVHWFEHPEYVWQLERTLNNELVGCGAFCDYPRT